MTDAFSDLSAPEWLNIPERMRSAIAQYVLSGEPVGGFLTAVLEDRLCESFARADSENKEVMADYASFMYWSVPADARGSAEKVTAWIKAGGINGIQASFDAIRAKAESGAAS